MALQEYPAFIAISQGSVDIHTEPGLLMGNSPVLQRVLSLCKRFYNSDNLELG